MKRSLLHIVLRCLAASLCAVALSSCVYDGGPFADDGGEAQPLQPLLVTFSLRAQASDAGSRGDFRSRAGAPDLDGAAFWGDDYESFDAVGFEERILEDNFLVTFYDAASGAYLGRLENMICFAVVPVGADVDIFRFSAVLNLADPDMSADVLKTRTVKMMVTANVPDFIPAAAASADITTSAEAGLGAVPFSLVGNDFDAIPMWGMTKVSFAGIAPGVVCDLGSVSLLRAMAKIEVGVDRSNPDLAEVKVGSVTVSRVNKSGYVLPGGWNTMSSMGDLSFAYTMHVPADAEVEADRSFQNFGDKVMFYLPECANGADDEIIMTVDYTIKSDAHQGQIRLCPYGADGKPDAARGLWNVVRNHYYQYLISGVPQGAGDAGLRFRVAIADMEKGGEYVFAF